MKIEKNKLAAVMELLCRVDADNASGKPEWITVEEAVKRFKVSRWTLLRWRKKGWISAKKLGTAKAAKEAMKLPERFQGRLIYQYTYQILNILRFFHLYHLLNYI